MKGIRQKAETSHPLAKKMENFFFFNLFFPKVFYRHLAFSFDNPLENKVPEGPENKHPSHKTLKKLLNFLKNFSNKIIFVDTCFAVLTTALEEFQQKCHKVWHRGQTW